MALTDSMGIREALSDRKNNPHISGSPLNYCRDGLPCTMRWGRVRDIAGRARWHGLRGSASSEEEKDKL